MEPVSGKNGKFDQLLAELEIVGWPDGVGGLEGWRVGWMIVG